MSINTFTTKNIIRHDNYDTLLIPINNILKSIGIIYPNDLSIFIFKNKINNIIADLDMTIKIKLYKLYQENLYLGPQHHSISSTNYSYSLINTWDDTNNDTLKNNNFKIALDDFFKKDIIDDIIIFGHQYIYFHEEVMNLKTNKNIIYFCFDDNNNYIVYINGIKNDDFILNDFLASTNLTIEINDKKIINNINMLYHQNIISINDTKYFCISILEKQENYFYKTNKLQQLHDDDNIISIDEFNIKNTEKSLDYIGLYNMLTFYNKDILVSNINVIKKIIELECNTKDNIVILIIKTFLPILNIYKNKLIDENNIKIKTDKFNIIEHLKIFAKNEQFKFEKLNKQIRQNENIIKNTKTIYKCHDEIIKWENIFNNYIKSSDIINSINSMNSNDLNNSCDIYNLILSRTNWIEELELGNIIGMLIHVVTPKLAKLGITMNRVEILNTSNNLISFEQICEAQNIFNNDKKNYDDGRNIKELAISGNALGYGNCIIPLYINKLHWTLAKTQLNYCMGIIVNQNPFDYYYKFYEIYPMVLLNLTESIISNRNNITDKDIITFIQLIITTNFIFKDVFKYKINNISIDDCTKLYTEPKNRTEKVFDNNDCLLGFTILSNNKQTSELINKFKTNSSNVFREEIRRGFKRCYHAVPSDVLLTELNYDWFYTNILKISSEVYNKNIIEYKFLIDSYLEYSLRNSKKTFDINDDLIINILKKKVNNYITSLDEIDNHTKPISKIICWNLINELNNDETILHLNNVINNKYGNITDECIKYFKNNLIKLNKKYMDVFNDVSESNILSFFGVNDSKDLRYIGLYLQSAFSRDQKYIETNYVYDPLSENFNPMNIINNTVLCTYITNHYLENEYFKKEISERKEYIIMIINLIKDNIKDEQCMKNIIKVMLDNAKNYNKEFEFIIDTIAETMILKDKSISAS